MKLKIFIITSFLAISSAIYFPAFDIWSFCLKFGFADSWTRSNWKAYLSQE